MVLVELMDRYMEMKMSVKENLEIFLITYNRSEKLKKTLNKIFESDSPVKEFNIKVIDNASTDDTQKICKEYLIKNTNLVYIRNKINIGLSGNIIKTMELASKKWLWTICDDDDYDWTEWNEIEKALEGEYDIVHTTFTEGFRNETYPYLINEEAFIPTAIYNTKHITPLTMQNAYAMAYTILPHHAIGCKVINEMGKIFVPKKRMVLQGTNDKFNYFRTHKNGLFHRFDNYQLLAGYIGAYQLIEDENVKFACCNLLCFGLSFRNSIKWFLSVNKNYFFNIAEIFGGVSITQKATLLSEWVLLNIKGFLIRRNRNDGTFKLLGSFITFKYKK